jgi:hypothetical protein
MFRSRSISLRIVFGDVGLESLAGHRPFRMKMSSVCLGRCWDSTHLDHTQFLPKSLLSLSHVALYGLHIEDIFK